MFAELSGNMNVDAKQTKGIKMTDNTEEDIVKEAARYAQNHGSNRPFALCAEKAIELYKTTRTVQAEQGGGEALDSAWKLIIEHCSNIDDIHLVLGGYFGTAKQALKQPTVQCDVDVAGLMRHLHFKLEPTRLQAVIINTAVQEYFNRPDLAPQKQPEQSERIQELEGALEFYSDRDNWGIHHDGTVMFVGVDIAEEMPWDKAKQALGENK